MIVVIIRCVDNGRLYAVMVQQPRVGSGLEIAPSEFVDPGEVFRSDPRYFNDGERFAQFMCLSLAMKEMTKDDLHALQGRELAMKRSGFVPSKT